MAGWKAKIISVDIGLSDVVVTAVYPDERVVKASWPIFMFSVWPEPGGWLVGRVDNYDRKLIVSIEDKDGMEIVRDNEHGHSTISLRPDEDYRSPNRYGIDATCRHGYSLTSQCPRCDDLAAAYLDGSGDEAPTSYGYGKVLP